MKKIIEILERVCPGEKFEGSDDFFEDDLIDSFAMIELITELENEYAIQIDGLDIVPENFNNVENIIRVIQKNGGTV